MLFSLVSSFFYLYKRVANFSAPSPSSFSSPLAGSNMFFDLCSFSSALLRKRVSFGLLWDFDTDPTFLPTFYVPFVLGGLPDIYGNGSSNPP